MVTSALTYRQRQLVTAFVFLAKCQGRGAKLSELAEALGVSKNSATVGDVTQQLVAMRVVRMERMWSEPHAPWRLWADPIAQERCGQMTIEEWKNRS